MVDGKPSGLTKEFVCHSTPRSRFETAKGPGLPPVVDGMYLSLKGEWEKSLGGGE